MAMSERRFASEIIDTNGGVHKFDDLHCLREFLSEQKPAVAAVYVMDYEGRKWVPAEQAWFVRSDRFQTPMGGGIIALRDRAAAERYAERAHNRVFRYEEIRGH